MSLAHATRSMIDAKERELAANGVRPAERIVLSYAHPDRAFVEDLAAELAAQGIPVWWDDRIGAGQCIDDTIIEALEQAAGVVVLWSEASVKSDWVRWEAIQAMKYGKLIPVALPGLDLRDIRPPFSRLNTLAFDNRRRLCAEVERYLAGRA